MAIVTLDAIIELSRELTSSGNDLQLTNEQIIDNINSFYLYDLPAKLRTLKLKDRYTFNTVRGIDIYPFDAEHYITVEMPCYCMKRIIPLYQQPWGNEGFWGSSSNWQFQENITQGNGSTGPYTGTLQNTPVVRSTNNNPMVTTAMSSTLPFPLGDPVQFPQANISRVQNILITTNVALGNTLNVTDDGNGNLIGNGSGTIDYDTGQIFVTFSQAVPQGTNIQVMYSPTVMSVPLSILYFQSQFTLRPVPDQGYTIELVAYRQPSQVLLGTTDPTDPDLAGVPELSEWWELLAAGAAKKIFQRRSDDIGIQMMDKMLAERYDQAEVRTYAQIGKQRIGTIYADQMNNGYGSNGSGWGGGWGI